MRELHLRPGSCPLCPVDPHRGVAYVSLHHLYDRDDVPANLQWLCGSGTTGHHGLITEEDEVARRLLGQHVVRRRPDFLIYLGAKAGAGKAQARADRAVSLWCSTASDPTGMQHFRRDLSWLRGLCTGWTRRRVSAY